MPVPRNIDVHPEGFYITWDDGHASVYPSRYLRLQCGCAECVGEWTGERLIYEEMVAADIRAVSVLPVGNYAIQITWTDNHSTGIYPFERLRQICQCPQCKGQREAAG